MKARRATQDDLREVAVVHKVSILDLCAAHYSAVELSLWTDALRPDGYAALLTGREFLVAEEEGRVLGFGVLDLGQSLINATYVSPEAVRRGIGRRLVEAMEDAARQGGVSRLHLNSTLNAVPFYERLGYVQREAAYNRLPTGAELPCVAMTKDLASER
jgi:GNAT superfamily N-acetyltransferase